MKKIKKSILIPALSCGLIAMSSQADAQVVVTFEQVGGDVIATWSGSLNNLGTFLGDGANADYPYESAHVALFAVEQGSTTDFFKGTATATTLISSLDALTSSTGSTGFGFANGELMLAAPFDLVANMTSFDFGSNGAYTMTFADQTLSSIGAESFNKNTTLAWTSDAGGSNTIHYHTVVPEPSSSLLIGLGAISVLFRRRR